MIPENRLALGLLACLLLEDLAFSTTSLGWPHDAGLLELIEEARSPRVADPQAALQQGS